MGNGCFTAGTTKKKSSTRSSSNAQSSSDKKDNSQSSSDADSGYGDDSDRDDERIPQIKVLLVGAGEAGKSTFFKLVTNQLNKLFSATPDLLEFKDSIYENILETIKKVLETCDQLQEYTDENGNIFDCRISELLVDDVEAIRSIDNEELTPDTFKTFSVIIKDAGFRTCFEKLRHLYYVPDGATYFLKNLERIGADGYIPTFTDVIHCRDRTTGVTHEELPYVIDDKRVKINVFDIGGQRAERKAWHNVFDSVGAIIFVLAISEFGQTCIEDNETDRLAESLTVWKVLNETPKFSKTPIYILFTKVDQLEKKLSEGKKFFLKPPENGVITFEPYDGDNSPKSVKEYVLDVCMRQIKNQKLVVHDFLNLTDPNVDFRKGLDKVVSEALKIGVLMKS